jgi:hypothetical protein
MKPDDDFLRLDDDFFIILVFGRRLVLGILVGAGIVGAGMLDFGMIEVFDVLGMLEVFDMIEVFDMLLDLVAFGILNVLDFDLLAVFLRGTFKIDSFSAPSGSPRILNTD